MTFESETKDFKIQNRIKSHLFPAKLFNREHKVISILDKSTSLATDKAINAADFRVKIINYSYTNSEVQFMIPENFGPMKIENLPKDVRVYDLINSGNNLNMLYTSNETNGKFWMTRLQLVVEDSDVQPKLVFDPQSKAIYKSQVDAVDGYIGMTSNDVSGYLISMKQEDGVFTIQKNKILGQITELEYQWIGEALISSFRATSG